MPTSEIELKFLVPSTSRQAVSAEVGRATQSLERVSLTAMYFDTPDRRLARAGLSWRLRREGRRWVQTIKAAGAQIVERFEHAVIRPGATPDGAAHAGTSAGSRLEQVLERASADGVEVGVRFKAQVRRTRRRLRVRGAVVDVAFDEGKLVSGADSLGLCEVEFELVSGSSQAMLALAERWRKRFGLLYEPRSKAERGDRLADGDRYAPVRKASRVKYADVATARDALGVVLDECLAQIHGNAIGLCDGDSGRRADHVHQLRIGVRRLRSALQSFKGWTPAPPVELVDGLKALFAELGRARDEDVLAGGVAAALTQVGAPRLKMPGQAQAVDASRTVRDEATQRMLLSWLAWRASLADEAGPAALPVLPPPTKPDGRLGSAEEFMPASPEDTADRFHRKLVQRLRRWHRRVAADLDVFDALDEPSLHALRKRVKRLRYAVEFFTPVLRRRAVVRYVKPLAVLQDRLGMLNDLFVARGRYEQLVKENPEAWFALGWITARIAEVRGQAKLDLAALAQARTPSC